MTCREMCIFERDVETEDGQQGSIQRPERKYPIWTTSSSVVPLFDGLSLTIILLISGTTVVWLVVESRHSRQEVYQTICLVCYHVMSLINPNVSSFEGAKSNEMICQGRGTKIKSPTLSSEVRIEDEFASLSHTHTQTDRQFNHGCIVVCMQTQIQVWSVSLDDSLNFHLARLTSYVELWFPLSFMS